MQILVDETKLSLLLEKKKEHIGKTIAWDSVLSAVSFCVSVFLATYENRFGVSGSVWKFICCGLGISFTIKVFWDLYKSKKNLYTYEDLYNDINSLNEILHRHSIVVIKDTFNNYPNRYLVYYDSKWDCKFFVNYKNNEDNESFIKNHVSSDLKVDVSNIDLKLVTQKIHRKFSNSDNKEKTYEHKFYIACIKNIPEEMKADSFEFDGRKYYWMTISNLEKDKDVLKKNMDILKIVKGYF